MSPDTAGARRAFVLGLDGVPWDLIETRASEGALPNFARLLAEGAAGPLRSTVPSTTPLAWPSIATGAWPDAHGIYGFRRVTDAYGQRANTSEDVARPALWDLLAPAVVGNVPMTYPAGDVDGEMVAGMMTPSVDADGFAAPPALADAVRREIPTYRIGLEWGEFVGDEASFLAELDDLLAARRALMARLMERTDWRLFFFVYTEPDRLQHLVGDEAVLLEHFRALDDVLGDVLEYVERLGGDLYVVSDHGFGPLDTIVYVNRVLEEGGLLARRQSAGARRALAGAGLTKDGLRRAIEGLGVDVDALARHLPDALVEGMAEQVPGEHGLYDVDFARTQAFVHGTGMLYVNDAEQFEAGPVPPEAVPGVKREARSRLEALRDPETGEPVLSVRDGDELFARDARSPDLVVDVEPGYEARTSLTDRRFAPAPTAGNHRPEGIVLAWGEHVSAGVTPADAAVVDVAPTLLHGIGEPVPERADGRVLDVFEPGSPPAERPVESRAYETPAPTDASGGDLEAVERRLRGLGYVE